jgi:hypothetical protein
LRRQRPLNLSSQLGFFLGQQPPQGLPIGLVGFRARVEDELAG